MQCDTLYPIVIFMTRCLRHLFFVKKNSLYPKKFFPRKRVRVHLIPYFPTFHVNKVFFLLFFRLMIKQSLCAHKGWTWGSTLSKLRFCVIV